MKQLRVKNILGFLLLVPVLAYAQSLSDLAKEKRWAEQVEDTLFDGELVWLDSASLMSTSTAVSKSSTIPNGFHARQLGCPAE